MDKRRPSPPARPRSAVARAVSGLQDSRFLLLREGGDGLARVFGFLARQLGVTDVLRDPLVLRDSLGAHSRGLPRPLLRLGAPLSHRGHVGGRAPSKPRDLLLEGRALRLLAAISDSRAATLVRTRATSSAGAGSFPRRGLAGVAVPAGWSSAARSPVHRAHTLRSTARTSSCRAPLSLIPRAVVALVSSASCASRSTAWCCRSAAASRCMP